MNTRKAPEGSSLASRALGVASPVGSVVLLVLAPKCPLCIAAYLASIGLGVGAAACLAPLLRPALFVFAALGVLALLWRIARRARPAAFGVADARASVECCCQPNFPP